MYGGAPGQAYGKMASGSLVYGGQAPGRMPSGSLVYGGGYTPRRLRKFACLNN